SFEKKRGNSQAPKLFFAKLLAALKQKENQKQGTSNGRQKTSTSSTTSAPAAGGEPVPDPPPSPSKSKKKKKHPFETDNEPTQQMAFAVIAYKNCSNLLQLIKELHCEGVESNRKKAVLEHGIRMFLVQIEKEKFTGQMNLQMKSKVQSKGKADDLERLEESYDETFDKQGFIGGASNASGKSVKQLLEQELQQLIGKRKQQLKQQFKHDLAKKIEDLTNTLEDQATAEELRRCMKFLKQTESKAKRVKKMELVKRVLFGKMNNYGTPAAANTTTSSGSRTLPGKINADRPGAPAAHQNQPQSASTTTSGFVILHQLYVARELAFLTSIGSPFWFRYAEVLEKHLIPIVERIDARFKRLEKELNAIEEAKGELSAGAATGGGSAAGRAKGKGAQLMRELSLEEEDDENEVDSNGNYRPRTSTSGAEPAGLPGKMKRKSLSLIKEEGEEVDFDIEEP
ncbi:unnamed protein product, partial [Amoebophrya sp. A120]